MSPHQVWVEPGLVAGSGSEARPAPSPGAQLGHSNSDFVSVIVRLEGPSIVELYSAERRSSARSWAPGGRAMSKATLQAVRDAMVRRQALAAADMKVLGADVVDSYQHLLNGFLVHASEDELRALARLPYVASMARAPLLELATGDSVPHIGARRVWDELGYKGRGSLVAVLDSGIDYTHAAFGGPGDPEAYAKNDETKVESGTFPTQRVVGGYDFAGTRYTASVQCGPYLGQECVRTPYPDDDPLDTRGHGTSVAGAIGGGQIAGLAPGVAPQAHFVALKIFGNPVAAPTVTDLLPSAFDWVAANNLEAEVPGFATERIDVVNLSLTGTWVTGWYETERLVNDAMAADQPFTLVVAAGNTGPYGYLISPVAGAEKVISVASSYPPGERGLLAQATWQGAAAPESLDALAYDSQISGQVRTVDLGGFEGALAWFGRACPDDPARADVSGKVALVERGACGFTDKISRAQAAGASAVIVFTTANLPAGSMYGQARLNIPAVMIGYDAGRRLVDVLDQGTPAHVRVYEPEYDIIADTLAPYSARGPARLTSSLRPQITAPGSFIRSAKAGTGTAGAQESGTSMAAAHVAGLAALLAQRNRAAGLGLDALDVGAMAINYAEPTVRLERQDKGRLAPLTQQGAGRVDAFRAMTGQTVVRSENGVAELSFGHVNVTDQPKTVTRRLTVRNLSNAPKTYRAEAVFAAPDEDGAAGVVIAPVPRSVAVPAKGSNQLTVDLTVDPAGVRAWPFAAREAVIDAQLLTEMEIDGFVRITEVDGSGQPVVNGDLIGVPFHVLPRRNSCVRSTTNRVFAVGAGEGFDQAWLNSCPEPGRVRVYPLLGSDPVDPDLPAAVDIEAVGMRYGPVRPGDPESDTWMEWAIATRGPRRIPQGTQFRIYIDVNRDGEFDWVAFTMYAADLDIWVRMGLPTGRWVSALAPTTPGILHPDYASTEGSLFYHTYDLDEAVTRLYVLADDIGLDLGTGGERFDFAVAVVDVKGDYALQAGEAAHDYAPDGLASGASFTYDQWVDACLAPLTDGTAPGSGELRVRISNPCPPPEPGMRDRVGLLMAYPGNAPGERQYEVRTGTIGKPGEPRVWIYLPYGLKP